MNRILFSLIFIFILIACKRDDIDPLAVIEPIEGAWKLVAIEKMENGMHSWESVTAATSNIINFRYDGVILDPYGNGSCCAPKKLVINGESFDIKPKIALDYAHCAAVHCGFCAYWKIDQKGNELILTSCETARMKYLKL